MESPLLAWRSRPWVPLAVARGVWCPSASTIANSGRVECGVEPRGPTQPRARVAEKWSCRRQRLFLVGDGARILRAESGL
jgi:hypothetical protein